MANGLLEVHLSFGDSTITTRALDYYDTNLYWTKRWNWNTETARQSTKDLLNYPVLIVTMKPGFGGGRVTVEMVDARWDNRKNMTSDFGQFRLYPEEWNKFRDYKLSSLNVLLGRYRAIFNSPAVRTRLSNELTQALLANSYVSRITGIDQANSGGTVITVTYD